MQREEETEGEKNILHLVVHSPNGYSNKAGQAKVRSQDHHLGLACGDQEPKQLGHCLLASQVHKNETRSKVKRQALEPIYGMPASHWQLKSLSNASPS